MPGRRRRGSQNTVGFIILIALVVLWYLGKIPGLPPLTSVVPEARQIGTLFPPIIQLQTPAPETPVPEGTSAATASAATGQQPLGQRTKTSGCISANALPDPACTPGDVFPTATREQICTPGYSSSVRNVPESEKNQVYAEYGIASHSPGEYEVDHLISLELGGSNSIANLWPEPAEPTPGFHQKDQVENYLHDQVCSGAISLQEAQSLIAHDWLKVYESMPK